MPPSAYCRAPCFPNVQNLARESRAVKIKASALLPSFVFLMLQDMPINDDVRLLHVMLNPAIDEWSERS
jgi:hypothetical protein